jgi:hypothetical protein
VCIAPKSWRSNMGSQHTAHTLLQQGKAVKGLRSLCSRLNIPRGSSASVGLVASSISRAACASPNARRHHGGNATATTRMVGRHAGAQPTQISVSTVHGQPARGKQRSLSKPTACSKSGSKPLPSTRPGGRERQTSPQRPPNNGQITNGRVCRQSVAPAVRREKYLAPCQFQTKCRQAHRNMLLSKSCVWPVLDLAAACRHPGKKVPWSGATLQI